MWESLKVGKYEGLSSTFDVGCSKFDVFPERCPEASLAGDR